MKPKLLHPKKFAGDLVAVRVEKYFRDGNFGDQLLVDLATRQELHRGLTVRQGGLVNQWINWAGAGVVVGVLAQISSGYSVPWQLHPVPERERCDVLDLLEAGHVVKWLSCAPGCEV